MLNAEVLQIIHTWETFHRPGYRLLGTQGGSLPLLRPLSFLFLRRLAIAFPQIPQPLRLRDLCLHLHDQHFQLLLALLASMGIDIAGVLFTVGPFGRIAAFKQVVVDLADAAGAGPALAAHVDVYKRQVFRNAESCTGGADDYLRHLTTEIIPTAEKELAGVPSWRGIAGYSLAGLFALYLSLIHI